MFPGKRIRKHLKQYYYILRLTNIEKVFSVLFWTFLPFFVMLMIPYGENVHTIHGLRTPRQEIAFTAQPKIQSQSQIFRYGRSLFCLPHQPNFSDIFDLCLHWVSVVRVQEYRKRELLVLYRTFSSL